ncbi:HAD family hydrolase [Microbacterium marinilacus]|uniref:HAD family hydrolase n=1 Tax=Microbacterium marinilacus TaxID=415209 RepID=A0ABP7B9I8_9MICO|nr:HAD family hydrolase [Microbacterium marinilacus]MBY0687334.1 haloacid dehalogenase-like hydrolase [Microbacterium marinilacus]
MTRQPRTAILDFDGTVCIGDGPALAYARRVAEAHPSLADLPARIARWSAGEALDEFADAADGYMAVQQAARAAGIGADVTDAAFRHARDALAGEGLGVRTPEGFATLARDLRAAGVAVVLVTNAPASGLDRILALLGVDDCFDDVVADAGKPAGLGALLDALPHPVTHDTVLSVGDIWRNDLAVPQRRGAATALIDPHGRGGGTPDARAATFEGLEPWIRSWAGIDERHGRRRVTSS